MASSAANTIGSTTMETGGAYENSISVISPHLTSFAMASAIVSVLSATVSFAII